jgi:hypothetical protein
MFLLRSCMAHTTLVRGDGIPFTALAHRTRGDPQRQAPARSARPRDFGSRIQRRVQLAYWRAHWQLLASGRLWHDDRRNRIQAYRATGFVSVRRLATISKSAGMISARSQSKNVRKSTGMTPTRQARDWGGSWRRQCEPISHARDKVVGPVVRGILKICPRDAEPRPDDREEPVVEIESEGTTQVIPDPSDPLIAKLPVGGAAGSSWPIPTTTAAPGLSSFSKSDRKPGRNRVGNRQRRHEAVFRPRSCHAGYSGAADGGHDDHTFVKVASPWRAPGSAPSFATTRRGKS